MIGPFWGYYPSLSSELQNAQGCGFLALSLGLRAYTGSFPNDSENSPFSYHAGSLGGLTVCTVGFPSLCPPPPPPPAPPPPISPIILHLVALGIDG